MKLTPVIFVCISLVGNAVLAVLVLKTETPTQVVNAPSIATRNATSPTTPTWQAELWEKLSTRGFSSTEETRRYFGELRTRLSECGFPDNIINSIIEGQINEHFGLRRMRLAASGSQEFWAPAWDSYRDRKSNWRDETVNITRDERRARHAAFGEDITQTEAFQRLVKRDFAGMPVEKVLAVVKIDEDYTDLTHIALSSMVSGARLPEDREQLATLEKEKRADLTALLTQQELLEYDLRNSEFADALREELGVFGPNEQEFRALFVLKQDFESQLPKDSGTFGDPENPTVVALQKDLADKIKAALGENRYAEFQRSQNYDFQQLAGIAERLELKKETAITLHDFTNAAKKRAEEIRKTIAQGDARKEALAALVNEVNTTLNQSLGPGGTEAYNEKAGAWLKTLNRP